MTRIGGRPRGYTPDGAKIRHLRKMVHGLTTAELGARAGLTEYVVKKAERSLPVMDITAVRLAKALGVEVEDIASPPQALASLDAKNGPVADNDRANERDTSRSTQ